MRNKVIRGLSLLAFLLSLAWFAKYPEFESGIAAILLLIGLISATWVTSDRPLKTADISLLEGEGGSKDPGPPENAENALLVLPLRPIPDDGDGLYLCDGLTEEIIVALSSIESLRVISHNSALRLRGSEKSAAELAYELGVGFVLEGSVRREEARFRVMARLVDARKGTDVWADRFDGDLSSILEIQQEVAEGIGKALELKFTPPSEEKRKQRLPRDPRVLEAYLRARHELWGFSEDSLNRAIHHLENGLSVAGEQETLLAALGAAYCQFPQLGVEDPSRYLDKASGIAERIFAINPDSRHGHRLRGWVEFQAGRLPEAAPHLKRAWEADPSDPDTLVMLVYLYAISGKPERARPLSDHLVSIDPLTPVSHTLHGGSAIFAGDFEGALAGYRRAFELDPTMPFNQWCWAWALIWNRRFEEAEEVVAQLRAENPSSPFTPLARALSLAVQARGQEALSLLAEIPPQIYERNEMFSGERAHCYALAGDVDLGLAWLEKNVDAGNINYPFLSEHDWFLDNLRPDPRFDEILEDVRSRWEAFEL